MGRAAAFSRLNAGHRKAATQLPGCPV